MEFGNVYEVLQIEDRVEVNDTWTLDDDGQGPCIIEVNASSLAKIWIKTMATTDITIKPERRLCKVNGEYGYFHCWALRPLAYLKKVGYTSETVAIIEFEDRVACIYPWEVQFVDEENHELHWMNEHERKEKSDEPSLD